MPTSSPASTMMTAHNQRASTVKPVSSRSSRRAALSTSSPLSICPPTPLYWLAHKRLVGAPFNNKTASPLVMNNKVLGMTVKPVSYTHLRAHETRHDLVCRLLL